LAIGAAGVIIFNLNPARKGEKAPIFVITMLLANMKGCKKLS